VITATNRDLEFAVSAAQFREDLYFRLNVVTINLPPLRERREEIPLLVDHFLKKYSVQYNKPVTSVSTDLAREFMHYDWPGNVRQLENLIKRMVILGSEAQIMGELHQSAAHFSFRSQPSASVPRAVAPLRSVPPQAAAAAIPGPVAAAVIPASGSEPARVEEAAAAAAAAMSGNVSLKDIARTAAREAERELILRMLTRTRWNRKEAAEILGISYKALLYKIKESGLDKAS